MKTVTMPLEEYQQLEGELRALKQNKQQVDELVDRWLLGKSPQQLQEIRSDVHHPFWTHADVQLQRREANHKLSMGKT